MAEDKKKRFVRLAERRTNKIINMIRLLGNCSNRQFYEYTEEDIDKIFSTLQTELDNAKKRYQESEIKVNKKFTL